MLKFINVRRTKHTGDCYVIYTARYTDNGECKEAHSLTLDGFVYMYKLVQKELSGVSDIKCSSILSANL